MGKKSKTNKGLTEPGSQQQKKQKKPKHWLFDVPVETPTTPEDPIYKKAFWSFAIVLVLLMAFVSFDYGITGDEWTQKEYGHEVLDYLMSFGNDEVEIGDRGTYFYGGLFDTITAFFNRYISPFQLYDTRHLINSIFGFLFMLFTGLLAQRIGGWRMGLLALILMALSPRIFGHSMNNPKDIPFAMTYILTILFMIRFYKELPKPSLKTALLVALGIALSINIRIGGLLLNIYFTMFYVMILLTVFPLRQLTRSGGFRENIWPSLKYVALSNIAGYFGGLLFWPFALEAPFTNPFKTLTKMSNYHVNIRQLFEGDMIWSQQLPWYYLEKYIIITTPIIVLVGLLLFFALIYARRRTFDYRWVVIVAFVALFPLAYIIYKSSKVYGGWRHVQFVYGPLVVLAALGIEALIRTFDKKTIQMAVGGGVVLLLIIPLQWMIRHHPHQITYFNPMVGGLSGAYGNYETDYWMNGVKPALDWMDQQGILDGEEGNVLIAGNPGTIPRYKREYETDQAKLTYMKYRQRSDQKWDYGVFYSGFIDPYMLKNGIWPPQGTIYEETAEGVPLAIVVKRQSLDDYRGMQAFNQGDYQQAIKHFQNYLEADDQNEIVLARLGQAYYRTDQRQKAAEYFQKTLSIHPEDLRSMNFLGNIHMQNNNYQQAISVFTTMIKRRPNHANGYVNLGVAYARSGSAQQAISYLKQAIDINPRAKQAYRLLGQIYRQQGNQQEAQRYLNAAKQIR